MQWQTVAPPVVPTETQTSAEPRRGFPARSTGLIQALLGLALLICGIIVIGVDFPEVNNNTVTVGRIDSRDKQAWCIWIGVVIIFKSVFGIFSKKGQTLISLYMAFSITVSVISASAVIPVSISLGKSNQIRAVLQDDSVSSYDDPFKPYGYECYSNNTAFSNNLSQLERECIKDNLTAARLHLAMYCIMLTCLSAEFLLAIIGASSTCSGLDKSKPRQQVMYYQTQVPQFQSPSSFIVQNGSPPPYPGQLAPYPVIQTTGHALPSGGLPQQVVVPPVSQPPPVNQPSTVSQPPPAYQPPHASQPPPVSQPPPSDMYLTPNVREGATSPVQADDDSTYLQPNAGFDRAIPSPGNQQEYSYADPQYRPTTPPDDHSNNRADNEDDSYVTINN
ncbi:uncharacterized protein [Apostichopus japonicus]|uniref:uncharacterized protein isoform X1 n=1 Tax=Stichopus japonicus TaxID=307972 RepID=UPI003AB82C39